MSILLRSLAYWQYLSIDIALGAVGASMMVARMCKVTHSGLFYVLLGLGVWLVYTLDHLLDAWRGKDKILSPRHSFHVAHFRIIAFVWVLLGIMAFCIAFYLFSYQDWLLVLGLAGLSFLHFGAVLWVKKRAIWFVKEWSVAAIYTLGVWGFHLLKLNFTHFIYGAFIAFFALALQNLLLFASYEKQEDLHAEFPAWVQSVSAKTVSLLIFFLGIFATLFGLYSLLFLSEFAGIWYCITGIVQGFIFAFPTFFGKQYRYRMLADALFLLTWAWS